MVDGFGIGGFGFIEPWGSILSEDTNLISSLVEDPLGIIEATCEVIGESDYAIGGFTLTRLTSPTGKGDTTLQVESTLGFADSGKIALDGIAYSYTQKTLTSFAGISTIAAGNTVIGTLIVHSVDSAVMDLNRDRSALDLVRRAMLVDYAEGTDLTVVGRNLAVPRVPLFTSDDQYREVIKAIAYNPKGTIYGIRLALDAILGVGNYEIYEDLLKYPNTVFIKVDGDSYVNSVSAGKAFLESYSYDKLEGTQDTLTVPRVPKFVGHVRLASLNEQFLFTDALPSGITYPYYPDATPESAFSYTGSLAEGSGVSLITTPDKYIQLNVSTAPNTVLYTMLDTQGARITEETDYEISWYIRIPTGSALTLGELKQLSISVLDGTFEIGVGLDSDLSIGLFGDVSLGFVGETVTLSYDKFYTITLKKQGDYVSLLLDNKAITMQSYAALQTDSVLAHRIEFGLRGNPSLGMIADCKYVSIKLDTPTDYWGARESTGEVVTASPHKLSLGIGSYYTFIPEDEGKWLTITNSTVTNSYGGNNNGSFLIDSVDSALEISLLGKKKVGATVSSANPTRVITDFEEFVYPDDLGKELVISDSTKGNDGIYIIQRLLEPGTLVDYASYSTPIKANTNVCEVEVASFSAEAGLGFQINPQFVTESNLTWEQLEASEAIGTVLTLRQSLWSNDLVMAIRATEVLSAQLLKDITIRNEVISSNPLKYKYYPFYLSNVFGLLKAYFDDLTVAGVIPEFILE